MVSDFRKFIARGNVIDLAVGIVIGAAFTTVVKSFVDDVLMPPIGAALGRVDFRHLVLDLPGEADIRYGLFINNIIAFLITAFAVFLLVKAYERMRRQEEAAPPEPTEKECPFCASKISIKASRCPACTSELAPSATVAAV